MAAVAASVFGAGGWLTDSAERWPPGGVTVEGGTGAAVETAGFSDCGPADDSAGRKGEGPTSAEGCAAGSAAAGAAAPLGGAELSGPGGCEGCDEGSRWMAGGASARWPAGSLAGEPAAEGAVPGAAAGGLALAGATARCSMVGASAAGVTTAVAPEGGVGTGDGVVSGARCTEAGAATLSAAADGRSACAMSALKSWGGAATTSSGTR